MSATVPAALHTAVPTEAARPSRWARAIAVLAALGATLGVALDHMHVATGTIAYADPGPFHQAWWAFPLFAGAGVGIGLARPVLERLTGTPIAPASAVRTSIAMCLFVAAYLASGLLDTPTWVTCAVLGALAVASWWVADRRRLGVALAVGAAIAGSAIEATLVALNQFTYAEPGPLGIGVWLPLLYACAGTAVGALGSLLVDG